MDGCVTEVTERSGRGTEVMERVRRLQRYADFMERCMEGKEICGSYGDLHQQNVGIHRRIYNGI